MSTNFGKNYKWTERDRITWETDIDKKDNYEYDYEEPIVDPRYYDYLKGYSDLPHRSLADRLRHKKPTIYGRSREGRRLYGPANISDLGMPTNFNFKREWIADKLLIEEALNVEFKQLLGEGAFGQVWRVRVVANRTHYAAKVLELRRFATDKNANVRESMKQMLLEVDAVRGLQHPNLTRIEIVLHVRDAVTDFPSAFVVIFMELCDGSLEDEIYYRPNHQMTEREARDWFFQIIGALKYLHENRVAHMDIKPENILVQKQPQAVYKLADLGLALTFQPNEPMLTNDRLLGTPGFLAPELVYQDALSIRKLLGITLAVSLGGASRFSHYLNPQHGMTLNLNAYMRDTLLRPDGRFSETDDVITLLKVLTLFTHRLANNRLTNTT